MKTIRIICLVCMTLSFGMTHTQAQNKDEEAIKSRIIERVSDVDSLKSSAKVGENNQGYLEQRTRLSKEETQVLEAENADRRALYTIVAMRLGITATIVGKGRADELRDKSAEGVWLQNPEGIWFQKK